ncbi:MAG: M48 family metallopeptidase [Oscillospiraceae bacterium]|nr:M48 family metallopeptidase [Oscillospiraceae bacterium]MCL2278768.1 M48 family metallopeptidase [Oscillospiraceae bacterium]
MVDYTLTRSVRKTIALHVRDGSIEVRAPLKSPQSIIDNFVSSKEKWIEDKLLYFRDRAEQRANFHLNYGDCILYRGKKYPIESRFADFVGFEDDRFYVPAGLSSGEIKEACIQIYRKLAKQEIVSRTQFFAEQMSVTPTAIRVNGAKTRWGSCSSKKSLNFSWRLIMADDDLIDYVVVHELAHLSEMNHSNRFWSIIESVLPDYKRRKAKLKELHLNLGDETWD